MEDCHVRTSLSGLQRVKPLRGIVRGSKPLRRIAKGKPLALVEDKFLIRIAKGETLAGDCKGQTALAQDCKGRKALTLVEDKFLTHGMQPMVALKCAL